MRRQMSSHARSRPVVAFDEAGNTGQDLLNTDQPVFVLASVHLSDRQAAELLDIARGSLAQEVHFNRLRRSSGGRARIINLLRSPLITTKTAKLNIVHKEFMVVTKMVDLLIETMAHRDGIDLYERGANIALANAQFYALPTLCGRAATRRIHQAFVTMIRERTEKATRQFFSSLRQAHDRCKHEEGRQELRFLATSVTVIGEVLANVGVTTLDPAIPTFVQQCGAWGQQFGGEFDIVHDPSKPILQDQELLTDLMARDEPETMVGYDRRKFVLPLKSTGVRFADSVRTPQIQIADVLASACAHWAAAKIRPAKLPEFVQGIEAAGLPNLLIDGIWPSTDVTPSELGTEETGGLHPADYAAELIARQRRKRNSRRDT